MSKRFLVKLMYLGFRYHGVQKQPNFNTIQAQFEKSIENVFGSTPFKTRFSSRTDALVSSLESYVLIMSEKAFSLEALKKGLGKLPADIKIVDIAIVDEKFSLQKNIVSKTYHYSFSCGDELMHPFVAPHMAHFIEKLDIQMMEKGAKLFIGEHNFKNYCYKPKSTWHFEREILSAELVPHQSLSVYAPKEAYIFKVTSKGFLRGQMRLMMGSLLRLGLHEMSLSELSDSLKAADDQFVKWLAPSSGLLLVNTQLNR